ncbi:hypothetical protein P8452_45331 [Trifolium repens]|nr:hypothetical protein P8452_45331 [Trifolium repens]
MAFFRIGIFLLKLKLILHLKGIAWIANIFHFNWVEEAYALGIKRMRVAIPSLTLHLKDALSHPKSNPRSPPIVVGFPIHKLVLHSIHLPALKPPEIVKFFRIGIFLLNEGGNPFPNYLNVALGFGFIISWCFFQIGLLLLTNFNVPIIPFFLVELVELKLMYHF